MTVNRCKAVTSYCPGQSVEFYLKPARHQSAIIGFGRVTLVFLFLFSDPQRKPQNAMDALYAQKKTETASNVPYFSPWGSWTVCSTSCGLGTKTRQRSCIYTHAQSGWQTCHGVTFQAEKCDANCPGMTHLKCFIVEYYLHWTTTFKTSFSGCSDTNQDSLFIAEYYLHWTTRRV